MVSDLLAIFRSARERLGLVFHIPLALRGEDRHVRPLAPTKVVWEIALDQTAFVCRVVWCFCLFRR